MKAKYFLHASVVTGLLLGMILGSAIAAGWETRL